MHSLTLYQMKISLSVEMTWSCQLSSDEGVHFIECGMLASVSYRVVVWIDRDILTKDHTRKNRNG